MNLEQTLQRIVYYTKGFARDLVPHPFYAAQLRAFRSKIERQPIDQYIHSRVNYYNKLTSSKTYSICTEKRPEISEGSRYYYDLMENLNYFDKNLKIDYIFLDLTTVPNQPALVKSRPIHGNNENSVLYKYIKLRNFRFYVDPYTWDQKLPKAVWRGGLNNRQWRVDLVRRHHANPRCDIGHNKGSLPGVAPKGFLSPTEQMRCRYVVSVEGNDVATNLKWALASNSLCLMPRPRFETWFMEGKLEAGVHYCELRSDYEDLDEKICYYEKHPDEAKAIIINANRHAQQFLDLKREKVISLLVLQKYFERTNQASAWENSAGLFT